MPNAGWGRAPFRTWLRESVRTVLWPRHGLGRVPGGAAVLFDLRTALQSLRRSPGFTLIAVVTLGLGVGANTAMFGVLNGLLLRPAPYADSGRLDRIFRATPQDPRGGVSPADYLDLRSEISGYGQVAAYAYSDVCLSEPGRPAEMVSGLRISANLLSTLATQPRLGRTFRANDELAGNHRVLILSHRYWQRRFGGESDVVGRGVRVGGELHEIVGVLPDDFSDWRHLGSVDVFKPLGLTPEETRDRSSTTLNLIGRRSSSVSSAQADALIAIFGRRLAAQHAALHSESSWRTVPLDDSVVPENRRRLLGLLVGLSGFVLLIACSNLANLTLSRTVARARELAVRSALGASRSRTLRPLLFESLLLALAGGLGAVFVARLTFDWLTAEGGIVLTFDWRVCGWAFGASLLTVVAFAAAPALFLQRLDLNRTLQSGSRGTAGGLGHRRFRQLLVVGQYALATVLLAGAALSLRGLDELRSRHTGWRSERLITGSILLPAAPYPGPRDIAEFRELAVRRVEALPGVVSASTSDSLPFLGPAETRRAVIAGRAPSEAGREAAVRLNAVSAHHFETVGTRLLSGRSFDDGDTPTSPRVFIINEAMARDVFAGESPLGQPHPVLVVLARAGPGLARPVRRGQPHGGPAHLRVRPPARHRRPARGHRSARPRLWSKARGRRLRRRPAGRPRDLADPLGAPARYADQRRAGVVWDHAAARRRRPDRLVLARAERLADERHRNTALGVGRAWPSIGTDSPGAWSPAVSPCGSASHSATRVARTPRMRALPRSIATATAPSRG